jgi:CheY-like chemotaxis protein
MARVLIVEDDISSSDILGRLLRFAGHDTAAATNGQEALKALQGPLPDVVLLDLMMPVMNGVEVLSHIRNTDLWRNLRVIVISALSSGPEIEAVHKLGAEAAYVKGTYYFGDLLNRLKQPPTTH